MDKKKELALVYMVAGISSRFGGKIKQFARVGKNNETLIEVSLKQALNSKFTKIIFIVGKMTAKPFKEMFGEEYRGLKVEYAMQEYDEKERDKPWGTVDALLSAKDLINSPFVVCNGDDLYGSGAFKTLVEHLSKTNYAGTVAYRLSDVLPQSGAATRGIIKINGIYVGEIKETFNIEKNDLASKGLSSDDLCNMNIFGFHEDILTLLERRLEKFKKGKKGDRKAECILPIEISELIKEGKIKMHAHSTKDKWLGITNPEDEEEVKREIKKLDI